MEFYVDDINLLDEETAHIVLNVVNDGYVNVEREGISLRYPCRPVQSVLNFASSGKQGNAEADSAFIRAGQTRRVLDVPLIQQWYKEGLNYKQYPTEVRVSYQKLLKQWVSNQLHFCQQIPKKIILIQISEAYQVYTTSDEDPTVLRKMNYHT